MGDSSILSSMHPFFTKHNLIMYLECFEKADLSVGSMFTFWD